MNKLKKIEKLRNKIDRIDSDLVKIVAKRFKVTKKIGILKVQNNLPREDKNREIQIMEKVRKMANKLNLNNKLMESIFELIIEDAKK